MPVGQTYNKFAWGGEGPVYDDQKHPIFGTTGADKDVDYYRGLGASAQQQAPVQMDQTQANATRGVQMGSMALMEQAAHGNAPSQAQALGQAANSDAYRAQLAQQAAAHGGAASIGAARMAGVAGANQDVQNVGQMATMRAREMAQNQGGYFAGANGMRGEDIQAATKNAQLAAQQRAMAEQQQQAYERMAWNTRNAEMGTQNEQKTQEENQRLAERKQEDADNANTWDKVKDVGSALASVAMFVSDERAKRDMVPIGSLSSFMGKKR